MKNRIVLISIIFLVSSTAFGMGLFRRQQEYAPLSTNDEPVSYPNALKNMMLYDIEDPTEKDFLKAVERGDTNMVDEYLTYKWFTKTASKNLFTAAKQVAVAKKNSVMIKKLSKF